MKGCQQDQNYNGEIRLHTNSNFKLLYVAPRGKNILAICFLGSEYSSLFLSLICKSRLKRYCGAMLRHQLLLARLDSAVQILDIYLLGELMQNYSDLRLFYQLTSSQFAPLNLHLSATGIASGMKVLRVFFKQRNITQTNPQVSILVSVTGQWFGCL